MKTLILAAIIALSPAHSFAGDVCSSLGNIAESIMIKRQQGVKLSEMMKIINSLPVNPITEVTRFIVIGVYKKPRYLTETFQNQAIANFRNKVELACYAATVGG